MSEFEYSFTRVEMLDTGIGKAMGFESDAAMREHVADERAKLDPEVQGALKDFDRMYRRRLMYGF